MKKWLALLLMLCILTPSAFAEPGEKFTPYEAVIANPLIADRLNVREKPDKNAESLGRFYSGTPVYVTDETTDKEGNVWAYLQVGFGEWSDGAVVRGWALREYLMRKNRNYGAPERFVTAAPADSRVVLRSAPQNSADPLQILSGAVAVLGDVGDDWRYVMLLGSYGHGYVKTNQLKNRTVNVDHAFIRPANGGEKAALYEDKELKKQIAVVYAGAPACVTDFTRDGWARVTCYGTVQNSRARGTSAGVTYERDADESAAITGYIAQKDLLVFARPWGVETKSKTGYALREIPLGQGRGVVPQGAALTVMGEKDGQYQVAYRAMGSAMDFCALVDKTLVYESALYTVHNEPASIGFARLPMHRDSEGYAEGAAMYVTPGDEPEYGCFADVCEVLSELSDGWLQCRILWESSFFVQEPEAEIIYRDALWPQAAAERGEGAWTADESTAGLWLFTAQAGREAALTLENDDKLISLQYEIQPSDRENAVYAVFIPAGTQVTLTGAGKLTPFDKGGNYPVLLAVGDSGEKREDDALFVGSGRFFCDTQIADCYNYYSFRVRPIPGAQEPWYAVSTLFDGFDDRIDSGLMEEGSWFVDLAPGEFLTLHECELYIYYGNG